MAVKAKRKGDLSSRRTVKVFGPFKIFLGTDRRDENGKLVIVDYQDPASGLWSKIPEREGEPFLEEVYFKKTTWTARREAEVKALEEQEDKYKGLPLHSTIENLVLVLHSWDLTDEGVPVPCTFDGIVKHDVDSEIIYGVLNKFYEVIRPPKELSVPSQDTSSQEDEQESAPDNTD